MSLVPLTMLFFGTTDVQSVEGIAQSLSGEGGTRGFQFPGHSVHLLDQLMIQRHLNRSHFASKERGKESLV